MPKLRVKKGGGEKTTVVKAPDKFTNWWGKESDNARKEGWYAAQDPDKEGTIAYRNSYNPGANTVVIPGEKNYGHVAAVGYKNGTFDVVIRDANGKVRQTMKKGVSPADVRSYLVAPSNPLAQRFNSIVAGTNQDKPNASGSYAALYNQSLVK